MIYNEYKRNIVFIINVELRLRNDVETTLRHGFQADAILLVILK